jgi:hypothetical protein
VTRRSSHCAGSATGPAVAIPRTGATESAPRGFALRVLGNEAGKGLRLMWRRRRVTIAWLALNGFNYLMIQFFIGGGHIVLPVLALTPPALAAYTVAGGAALQGSGGIAEEVNGGTLEQAHLSPPRRRCWRWADSPRSRWRV